MKWISFTVGVLVIIFLFAVWPNIFHDPAIPASRWLLNVMHVQDAIARGDIGESEVKGKRGNSEGRLVYTSGSSGLFGVDGDTLSRLTGRQVVTLSTHASLSMDFHLARAERVARAGDVVVAAFEIPIYSRTEPTSFEQKESAIWRAVDYQFSSLLESFRITWGTPIENLLSIAASRLLLGPHSKPGLSYEASIKQWNLAMAGAVAKPSKYYSSLRLDSAGAIYIADKPSRRAVDSRSDVNRYGSVVAKTPNMVLNRIVKANSRLNRKGATLVVVPPPLMRFDEGSFNGIEGSAARFTGIMAELNTHGIDTPCNLESALLKPERFLDTRSHLNAWGSSERAYRLAKCLDLPETEVGDLAKDTYSLWHKILQSRERQAELQAWERRLLDMLNLHAALKTYHGQHGFYPVSEGWDGAKSKWGKRTPDWIFGLAPEFIKELPDVPNSTFSYMYRSNGNEFKIICNTARFMGHIKALAPEFIDPHRNFAVSVTSSLVTASW